MDNENIEILLWSLKKISDCLSSSRVRECFASSCFENYTKNFKAILLLFKKSSFMKLMKFSLFNNHFFASIIIFCQYLLSTLKYDHLKKYSTILIFNFSQVIRLKIEPLLDVQRKQINKNSRTKFQKIKLDCETVRSHFHFSINCSYLKIDNLQFCTICSTKQGFLLFENASSG